MWKCEEIVLNENGVKFVPIVSCVIVDVFMGSDGGCVV